MNPRLAKSHPVKDQQRRWAWGQLHDSCACCWAYIGQFGVILHTHHLVKCGRSDEECNLLRLCERCHRLAENEKVPMDGGGYWPKLSLGMCLFLKLESDSENWLPERLKELRHSRLPDMEPIPEVFYAERRRW